MTGRRYRPTINNTGVTIISTGADGIGTAAITTTTVDAVVVVVVIVIVVVVIIITVIGIACAALNHRHARCWFASRRESVHKITGTTRYATAVTSTRYSIVVVTSTRYSIVVITSTCYSPIVIIPTRYFIATIIVVTTGVVGWRSLGLQATACLRPA